MSFVREAVHSLEAAPVPDALTRLCIDYLVGRTRRQLAEQPPGFERAFARDMPAHPIAENTREANEQHYELPAAFFELSTSTLPTASG